MFEKNQPIGSYSIRRILAPEGAIQKYLSKDPFFNISVTLNVLDVRSLSQEQKHLLFSFLQKIFSLEHDAIQTVYDSGFESDYVFFTNPKEEKYSLLQRLEQGVSTEESLQILRRIASALADAEKNKLTHGYLSAQHIYFSQGNLPFIENFGVQHYYASVLKNEGLDYPLKNTLTDVDNILIKLRMSVTDRKNISPHINNQLDNLSNTLKQGSEIKNIIHLINKIDKIIKSFNIENGLEKKLPENSFNINKREEVLPFIRSVMEEKNKLKSEIYEKTNLNKKYEKKLSECDNKIKKIDSYYHYLIKNNRRKNKKILYIAIGLSFFFGVFSDKIYTDLVISQDTKNMNNVKTTDIIEKQQQVIHITTETVAKNDIKDEMSVKNPVGMIDSKIDEGTLSAPAQQSQLQGKAHEKGENTKKYVSVEPHDWLPKGEEFNGTVSPKEQDRTNHTGLTDSEAEAVFDRLISWAGAWERQDMDKYFACYSENFIPAGNRGVAAWKKLRLSRIAKPAWIKVFIQNISISRISASEVRVDFQQDYRSDSFEDQSMKVVTLSKYGKDWLITSEKSLQ